jgi:hypothetical protein
MVLRMQEWEDSGDETLLACYTYTLFDKNLLHREVGYVPFPAGFSGKIRISKSVLIHWIWPLRTIQFFPLPPCSISAFLSSCTKWRPEGAQPTQYMRFGVGDPSYLVDLCTGEMSDDESADWIPGLGCIRTSIEFRKELKR